jgi:hypothetical protein
MRFDRPRRLLPRPSSTPRLPVLSAIVALILGLAMLAGCGGSNDKETALPAAQVEAFGSPYCITAREWAVHELDGSADGAYASGGPAALKKWWSEQLTYLKTSVQQAPPELHDAEAIVERAYRTRLTPLFEKYGFDFKRIEAEASPSENALAEPTPEEQNAQQASDLYKDRVCGYGNSPPPADVTFTASAASKAYCKAAAAQQVGLEKVVSSGFDPGAFRTYVTSDGFLDALDAQDAAAPPEIAADVETDNEWVRTRKLELLKEFDYDLRRLMLEGSAEDLAVFTYFDPAIVVHDSRVTAYVQQVCGMG